MESNTLIKKFAEATDDIFSYLITKGFKKNTIPFCKFDLVAKIEYIGKNVAFLFTYEIIDESCGCYVALVVDSVVSKVKGQSNLWLPLFGFLVDYYGYRGGAKISHDIKHVEFKKLYLYDSMLQKDGNKFLNDDVSVFQI